MKTRKFLCISALCALGLFTACSSDDDAPVPGSSIPAKTYTAVDGLEITVDGATAYGQAVTFTPGQGATATVTIAGQGLDLSSIIGGAGSKAEAANPGLSIPTASIIPGSVKVEIPVTLEGDNDNATFSGSYTTDYCSFSYAGTVSAEAMTLDVKNIALTNTSLAGTYDLKPCEDAYYNVCRMEWYSGKGAMVELFPGYQMELQMKALLAVMFGGYDLVEVDGKKMKIFDALNAVLKSVTLGTDGSVTAVYGDTKVAGLPEKTSAKGLAQYVVTSDNQIRLILNPYAIIAASADADDDTDAETPETGDEDPAEQLDPSVLLSKLMPVAENLLPKLIPLMSQGVPVSYGPALVPNPENTDEMINSTDPNFVSFYLDTDFLLPILKDVEPLLKDEEVINFIVAAASQDPEMGGMAGMLPNLLQSLPDVIDTTTKLELGLDLQRR